MFTFTAQFLIKYNEKKTLTTCIFVDRLVDWRCWIRWVTLSLVNDGCPKRMQISCSMRHWDQSIVCVTQVKCQIILQAAERLTPVPRYSPSSGNHNMIEVKQNHGKIRHVSSSYKHSKVSQGNFKRLPVMHVSQEIDITPWSLTIYVNFNVNLK